MTRDGLRILDSDMHVFEPHDLYLNYMNSKWGDRIPRGEVREQREGEGLTLPRHDTLRARRRLADPHPRKAGGISRATPERRLYSARQPELQQCLRSSKPWTRRDWTWRCSSAPRPSTPMRTSNPTTPTTSARPWNEWMHDFCSADPSRLKGSALITLHDVDLAVKEARRSVKELGAVGLSLCPEPINGRHIHDHDFDPLWAEAHRPQCAHLFPSAGTAQPGPGIPPLRGPPQRGAAGQSLAQSRGVDPGRQRLLPPAACWSGFPS